MQRLVNKRLWWFLKIRSARNYPHICISVALSLFFHLSILLPIHIPSFGRLMLVNQQHFYLAIQFCGIAVPYLMAVMTVYIARLKCSLLHFFLKIRNHFTFLCSAYQMLETRAIFFSHRFQYRQVIGQWCVFCSWRQRTLCQSLPLGAEDRNET